MSSHFDRSDLSGPVPGLVIIIVVIIIVIVIVMIVIIVIIITLIVIIVVMVRGVARPILTHVIVAIFYPFSQFCEIYISLLSLQTQPNTAPNLFQRGVEYGKYVCCHIWSHFALTFP